MNAERPDAKILTLRPTVPQLYLGQSERPVGLSAGNHTIRYMRFNRSSGIREQLDSRTGRYSGDDLSGSARYRLSSLGAIDSFLANRKALFITIFVEAKRFELSDAYPEEDADLSKLMAEAMIALATHNGNPSVLDSIQSPIVFTRNALSAAILEFCARANLPAFDSKPTVQTSSQQSPAHGAQGATTDRLLPSRPGRGPAQDIFRTSLWLAFPASCAFCGCSLPRVLEAAHIFPWCDSNEAERMDVANGLILCANHHRLFDADLLTLRPDLRIELAAGVAWAAPENRAWSHPLENRTVEVPETHKPRTLEYLGRRTRRPVRRNS